MFNSRFAASAFAHLLQGPQVVVAVHKLVHGVEVELVGTSSPDVPERAEVALRRRRGCADGEGTECDLLQVGPPAAVHLPPGAWCHGLERGVVVGELRAGGSLEASELGDGGIG